MLETLKETNQLTCAKVFGLARQFKLKPMVIANEANVRDLKIHGCQLGCFQSLSGCLPFHAYSYADNKISWTDDITPMVDPLAMNPYLMSPE